MSWAPISYGSSVLFDTTILLLTLAKLPRNLAHKSLVGRQIFRDTLMYFSITAVTNIVVLSFQSLGEAHSLLKPNAVPFSTVMTVTMGSRVYLNLKLLQKRREAESEGIALSVPRSDKNRSASSGTDVTQGPEALAPPRGFAPSANASVERLGKVRSPLEFDDA